MVVKDMPAKKWGPPPKTPEGYFNGNDPACPQLPGTFFRLHLKPGFVLNLLNCLEISSPGGICLVFRLLP